MNRFSGILITSAIAIAPLLISCGGKGGGAGGGGGGVGNKGTVEIQIAWPGRDRYVPPYAESVVAKITVNASESHTLTINRTSDSPSLGVARFLDPITAGVRTMEVTAHQFQNGQGQVLARALVSVTIIRDQTTSLNVSGNLQSTIASLVIDNQPLEVEADDEFQLTGRALDSSGNILLIPSQFLTWTLTSGQQFGAIRNGNIFEGLAEGSCTILLQESGAGKSSSPAAVTVRRGSPQLQIAFDTNRSGTLDIWRMRADGMRVRQITTDSFANYQPRFSRDGTLIAFVSERDGNPEIYVMNSDGTNLRRLTTNAANDFSPSFNHDGTKIAFVSDRTGKTQIWQIDVNTLQETRLTNNASNDFTPSYSFNGTQVVFVSDRDDPVNGTFEIYTMNANGSGQTRRTTNAVDEFNPVFSPDGTKLVYESDASGFFQIRIKDLGGGNEWNLTNASRDHFEPAYSPDGTKICFIGEVNGISQIYIMNSDGSNQVRLTNDNFEYTSPSTRIFTP
jgi:Tol biopolymer transport system component